MSNQTDQNRIFFGSFENVRIAYTRAWPCPPKDLVEIGLSEPRRAQPRHDRRNRTEGAESPETVSETGSRTQDLGRIFNIAALPKVVQAYQYTPEMRSSIASFLRCLLECHRAHLSDIADNLSLTFKGCPAPSGTAPGYLVSEGEKRVLNGAGSMEMAKIHFVALQRIVQQIIPRTFYSQDHKVIRTQNENCSVECPFGKSCIYMLYGKILDRTLALGHQDAYGGYNLSYRSTLEGRETNGTMMPVILLKSAGCKCPFRHAEDDKSAAGREAIEICKLMEASYEQRMRADIFPLAENAEAIWRSRGGLLNMHGIHIVCLDNAIPCDIFMKRGVIMGLEETLTREYDAHNQNRRSEATRAAAIVRQNRNVAHQEYVHAAGFESAAIVQQLNKENDRYEFVQTVDVGRTIPYNGWFDESRLYGIKVPARLVRHLTTVTDVFASLIAEMVAEQEARAEAGTENQQVPRFVTPDFLGKNGFDIKKVPDAAADATMYLANRINDLALEYLQNDDARRRFKEHAMRGLSSVDPKEKFVTGQIYVDLYRIKHGMSVEAPSFVAYPQARRR